MLKQTKNIEKRELNSSVMDELYTMLKKIDCQIEVLSKPLHSLYESRNGVTKHIINMKECINE